MWTVREGRSLSLTAIGQGAPSDREREAAQGFGSPPTGVGFGGGSNGIGGEKVGEPRSEDDHEKEGEIPEDVDPGLIGIPELDAHDDGRRGGDEVSEILILGPDRHEAVQDDEGGEDGNAVLRGVDAPEAVVLAVVNAEDAPIHLGEDFELHGLPVGGREDVAKEE